MDDIQKRIIEKYKTNFANKSDDSFESVIAFAIETALYAVMDYCNLKDDEYPDERLDNVICLMAKDLIDETGVMLSKEELASGSTKSLTEGDFSISRETRAEAYQKMAANASFIKQYKRQLHRYRKLAR